MSSRRRLRHADDLAASYDVVICGGGTAGAVLASRLSTDPALSVLLVEAGGSDEAPSIIDSTRWMSNIGTERDWQFQAEPSSSLNDRTPPLPMGRVLGGGSSINGSVWARGHAHDFDSWAEATGDPRWSYRSVLEIYKAIEDWDGPADPQRRGTGGLLHVTQPEDPIPLVRPLLDAADAAGVPAVPDLNGAAMEGDGGCGMPNLLVEHGNRRVSIVAQYLRPVLDRSNLDVLLNAEITRVLFERDRAVGVRLTQLGRSHDVRAEHEVILALGAVNTPAVLMLSGIGNPEHLAEHGIDPVVALRAVGENFQDHPLLAGCIWEYVSPEAPRNNAAEFAFFTRSDPSLPTPDLMPVLEETPFASDATAARFDVPVGPASAWTLAPGLARPASRGRVLLDPTGKPRVEANFLTAPEDVTALIRGVELCREIGNSPRLSAFRRREVMPGDLTGPDLERFVRDAAGTYYHQSCTARMGAGDDAVVDPELRVHGLTGLRVTDASVMPQITTGNTMAPTVVIAERAAALIADTLHTRGALTAAR